MLNEKQKFQILKCFFSLFIYTYTHVNTRSNEIFNPKINKESKSSSRCLTFHFRAT